MDVLPHFWFGAPTLLAMGCWYLNPPRGRSWKQNLANRTSPTCARAEGKQACLVLFLNYLCIKSLLSRHLLFPVAHTASVVSGTQFGVCWNGSEAEFHPSCRIIISLKMQRCVIPGDYLLVLEIISLSCLFPQLQLLNAYSSEMCFPVMAPIFCRECHSYRYAGERHP